MSVNVTFSGVTYTIPVIGDTPPSAPWGANLTSYFQALAANALPRAGGLFTINGSDLDLGATYGLKAVYVKTRGTNLATAGLIRFENNATGIGWRNAANSGNMLLTVNASDQLCYDGAPIGNVVVYTANRMLVTDGAGAIVVNAVTATEAGYLSGVTSAIQTQINNIISGLTAYVPYTGATGSVDLGAFNLTCTDAFVESNQIIGDPGTEGAGINIGGVTYNSSSKVSDINGSNFAQTILHRHSTTLEPLIVGARSNSNTNAHIDVTNGMNLFSLYSAGWAGSNYKLFGQLVCSVDSTGTVSNTSAPGRWQFFVTPDGAVVPVEAIRLTNDKKVTFFGAVAGDGLTASRALTTNASKELTSSAVTDTELGYVSGVTSAIQTQIDSKATAADYVPLTSGNYTLARSAGLITVGNTVTETDLLSFSLAADALATNRAVRIKCMGNWSHDGTNTLTVRLKYGGTTVISTNVILTGTATTDALYFDFDLRANNATNAQIAVSTTNWMDGASAYLTSKSLYGTAAEDSTGALTVAVTVEWGTADASETLSMASEAVLV